MIPYNKKHFTIFTLLKALCIVRAEEKLINFFREYTGKKFILLTNSCRSALYLTYKALNNPGEIITSPLTCRSAIDPIVAAGYKPVFQDIDSNILTISPDYLEEKIGSRTRGIQIIHFGGFPCEAKKISEIAKRNKLYVIEDCAQGLFSEVDGVRSGTIGDYVCISLLKNAKGTGGGILATDDELVFRKAEEIQKSFKKGEDRKILFRIIRNLLEDHRQKYLFNNLYIWLLSLKQYSIDKEIISDCSINFLKLNQPSWIELHLNLIQLRKSVKLKTRRLEKGLMFLGILQKEGLLDNYKDLTGYVPSFVKLYMVSEKIFSNVHIELLNSQGIEAMHLEHKYGDFYQETFETTYKEYPETQISTCLVYRRIHNHLLSLPFHEDISKDEMIKITTALKNIIQ